MTPMSLALGWIAFGALVLPIATATMLIERWLRRRHTATPEPASKVIRAQCSATGCAYPGAVWVIAADRFGGGVRRVCHGCHDEGAAHGWWRRSLGATPTVFDFQIADETADLDHIEAYANGEAS